MRWPLLALILAQAAAGAVCETRVHPVTKVEYRHPLTGFERTIEVIVEEPLGADGKLPAVVWMHGGAGGGTPESLEEWRGVTARGCYLSVTIGHAWPGPAQAEKLCEWMGRTFPDDCGEAKQGQVKLLNLARPFDLRATLDYLLREWAERIDPERIAVGGHSAGAGAALMAAGAARRYEERVETFADPRPRAFLAFSPQGPGSDGMFAGSFDGIDRPVLIGTGAGDTTGGEQAEDRVAVFDELTGPDQYLLYVDDESAPHGRFGLGLAKCASIGGPVADEDCDRVIGWLSTAALRFLDAYLRGSGEARTWLQEDGIGRETGGVVRVNAK
ncbi:MAG: hypothetical protein R2748_00905 [Bryobacterales bacterium]